MRCKNDKVESIFSCLVFLFTHKHQILLRMVYLMKSYFFICLYQVFDGLMAKADDRPGVANVVCKHIITSLQQILGSDCLLPGWLVRSIVNLGMFGPVHNKAQR